MCFLAFLRRKRSSKRRVEDVEQEEEVQLPQPDQQIIDSSKSDKDDFSIITHPITINTTTVIRRFSWKEIISLSANFSTVIDQGGFSTVYLAHFPNSSSCHGAIKIHENTQRLNQNFRQEFDILLHLGRHQNIVQLLGYCDEQDDDKGGALLFEYVPSGNLQQKLHGKTAARMPWKSRMWIAFQLARAIKYLHHNCTLPIVHGDIKSSNILLDDQLNCKLCDFGSAKMGFSATLRPSSSLSLMGSPGYIDPHYLRTGIASKKNDVYSFGVILLELITGMEAFCSETEQLLTNIAGPLLRGGQNKVDLRSLMPAEDLSHSEEEEVMTMASISALCLTQQPSLRPSMEDIVTTMTNKISSIYCFLTTEKSHHDQP
ncbi:Salt tolerance receptor-like cytoplasmic kinase [Thalictrum thalictroides]|uniref:Salt tolerance receptor-like cytoplasmic kinase n=1 Tax=Thalictrum thalictroides TaxID=46969 RepID=A0A7J6VR37_THATH|nr:Salt tolerance receptor-like cytoplasmic kinase [Thalictrum thalictroides]